MGKFFIDIGNFNSLEHYYNKYLQFKTRNKIKDINQFKTFTEWEHEIDALGQNYKTKSDSKGEKTSEEVKQEKKIQICIQYCTLFVLHVCCCMYVCDVCVCVLYLFVVCFCVW